MAGAGGTVIVPWYANGFRADSFEKALGEIASVVLRYGASSYAVYRYRDDRYRFQQLAAFADYTDWERYWEGPEMIHFRTRYQSWYQIPVLYGWWDLTTEGSLAPDELVNGAGNGQGNGARTALGWGERPDNP
jgi:hypothetical protein